MFAIKRCDRFDPVGFKELVIHIYVILLITLKLLGCGDRDDIVVTFAMF